MYYINCQKADPEMMERVANNNGQEERAPKPQSTEERNTEVPVQPSEDETQPSEDQAQLISQHAAGYTRWTVIAGVAAAACLVFLIGMSVGLTRGSACDRSNNRWCQPASPRRAFVFTRFTSCAQVKEVFNADVTGKDGGVTGKDAQMSADSDSYYFPSYPSDYCDYCNCTISNENTWMMKGAPVLMESAPMTAKSADAAQVAASAAPASGAPEAAKDFTGTNNQVQVRIHSSTEDTYISGLSTHRIPSLRLEVVQGVDECGLKLPVYAALRYVGGFRV